jgi:hypothetical protein
MTPASQGWVSGHFALKVTAQYARPSGVFSHLEVLVTVLASALEMR